MAGTPNDPSDSEAFDPYRRRREIEQMEQRFRERADRHGGGPVSTGEIDQRVSDEMKQFFAESTERAARVVPHLDDQPGEGMKETTGEIRRKIDDFFSQVKDAGGGAATPNTQEIQARRPRWQGFFPGQGAAPASPSAAPAPQAKSSDDPPRPTLSRGLPPQATQAIAPQPAAPQTPAPQASHASPYAAAPAAGRSQASAAPAEDDRPKMDLKTALEKLRRHGDAGASASVAPAPRPAAPFSATPPAAPATPSPAASFSARPATPAPAPQRPDVRPAAASVQAPRPSGPGASQPGFVPPKREPTVRNLPPTRSDAPKPGPATTSVPVVPPRPEASIRGAPPARPEVRQAAAVPAMPPRREPSSPNLPSIRQDAQGPVTPQPAAFNSGAPRRDPAPAAPLPPAPAAPAARRAEPPAALRAQSTPPAPPAQPARPAAASQPAFEDEIDASGTGSGSPHDLRPSRPARPPSAAAAMRASSVGPNAARPVLRRPAGNAPLDRHLPRVPAAAASAPAEPSDADAARRPESPIRVLRHRSVVDVDVSSATGDDADAPAQRGPSAAAQAYRQSFGGARQPADADPVLPAARAASAARPAAPAARAERPAAGPKDPSLAFDQIFDELQGLVLDTLRSSVDESFEAARESEGDLAAAAGLPVAPAAPAPVPAAPARASRPSIEAEAQPAPRAADPSRFERVNDEDEGEHEPEAAPDAPYDWGVRKSQRPAGAWLIEGEEKGLDAVRRRPVAEPPVPMARAAQAPSLPKPEAQPAPQAESPAGSVGGRSYLVRKLGEEVTRFQPALDALRAKGLVSENDLADPDAPRSAPGSKSSNNDDMLSVDHFAQRKPVDLERELSPTKLVEDLRRLRRLTDALIAKGLLTEQDLQRPAEEE